MMEDDTSRLPANTSRVAVAEGDALRVDEERAISHRPTGLTSPDLMGGGESDEEEDDESEGDELEGPNAKYVTKLRPNDVLLGRGTGPNNNEGNVVFRTAVEELKEPYLSTPSRIKKRQLVRKAVETVKGKNGRFLSRLNKSEIKRLGLLHPENPVLGRIASFSKSYSPSKKAKKGRKLGPVYQVVDDEVAMEKTKQALRYICYKKDNPNRKRRKEGAEDDGDVGGDDSSDNGGEDGSSRSGGESPANANESSGIDGSEGKTDSIGSRSKISSKKKRQRKTERPANTKEDEKEKAGYRRSSIVVPPVPTSSQVLPGQIDGPLQRPQQQQENTLAATGLSSPRQGVIAQNSFLTSFLAQQPLFLAASLPSADSGAGRASSATAALMGSNHILREHLLNSAAAAAAAPSVYDPHILAAAASGSSSAAARLAAMEQFHPSTASLSSLLSRSADPFLVAALQQEQYLAAAAAARQQADELTLAAASTAASFYHVSPSTATSFARPLSASQLPAPFMSMSFGQTRNSSTSLPRQRDDEGEEAPSSEHAGSRDTSRTDRTFQ